MKKIKTYSELEDKIEQIEDAMIDPPFRSELRVDVHGNLYGTDICLCADEALTLGQWLVAFYGKEIT